MTQNDDFRNIKPHPETERRRVEVLRRLLASADRNERAEVLRAMTAYIPPHRDRALELRALQMTASITEAEGITHPDDVRAIHGAVLQMLRGRRARRDATRNQVLEALGMGAPKC